MQQETVIVLDFGGQYNQLIARRVRECNVYCEIYSYRTDLAKIKAKNPKGIIFTGGPNSAYLPDSPTIDPEIYSWGVPILGICYGSQLMMHMLGGKVCKAPEREYGKTLVDLDEEIERMSGRRIPDIFAQGGEAEFRRLETAAVAKFAKENRQILACGGGVVKTPDNVRLLRQNGVVVFIDRPVEQLAVGGYRPLSKSTEALRAMEAERRPLYQAAADVTVANRTTLEAAVDAAAEGIHEIFNPERA